nr:hypothetical protein [Streptomyces sp. 4R-3d]
MERIAEGRQTGAVLVVAAGELHVVQDDPVIRREQFGQGGQPREEVGLLDRAQAARWRQLKA